MKKMAPKTSHLKHVLLGIAVLVVIVLGVVSAYDLFLRLPSGPKTDRPHRKITVLDRIPLDLENKEGKPVSTGDMYLDVLCINGYKYVQLGRFPVSGINQIFRWDEELQETVPVRCSDFTPSGLHTDQ